MVVTDIIQQKKSPERYSVFIDGEFVFGLIMQDILYFKLKIGEEISQQTFQYIFENLVYIKAQDIALHYLGFKMRTTAEIKQKLSQKEFSEEVIEKVLEFLEKYHYTDDLKYARAYIRSRQRSNPRGKYALKMELRQRGVADDVIEEALSIEQPDELEAAIRLVQKKVKNLEKIDEKEQKRVFGFLQRRGYSYDIIKEAFREAKETV